MRNRKARVWEISLAKRPKTGEKFIMVKEDEMDVRKVIAYLAMQADVPEVVKEELKDWAPKEMTKDEIMEALGLDKDDGYVGLPEELRKELEARDAAIRRLELESLKKELEPVFGDKVELVEKLHKEGTPVEMIKEVGSYIKTLKDTIAELGKPKGQDGGDDTKRNDGVVEKEVERIMKEKGVSRGRALVLLAKERPDLIEEWR